MSGSQEVLIKCKREKGCVFWRWERLIVSQRNWLSWIRHVIIKQKCWKWDTRVSKKIVPMVPGISFILSNKYNFFSHSLSFSLVFPLPWPHGFIFPEANILPFSLGTWHFNAGLKVPALCHKVKPLLGIQEMSPTHSCMSKIEQILWCDFHFHQYNFSLSFIILVSGLFSIQHSKVESWGLFFSLSSPSGCQSLRICWYSFLIMSWYPPPVQSHCSYLGQFASCLVWRT